MGQCFSEEGEESLASGLRDDDNKRDRHLRCDGAFSGAGWAHIFEDGVSPESVAPRVPDSWPAVPLREHVVPEVGSSGSAGAVSTGVCSDFEEVRWLHFVVSYA